MAARAESHSALRYDIISDKRDYTGVDPIKGTVRDEGKAVAPNYGRRGMPERSVEAMAVEARKSASAEVRLTLKRQVLVNEGLAGHQAKGARVRDNFDASLYNPRASVSVSSRVVSRAATPAATAREVAEVRALP